MKIRTLSLFSGIGAFEKALERQGIEHEIVAYCEIDKYASKSYAAIHNVPESMNLGDITKADPKALPDFDLLTWGFPCQDISIAGHLKGIVEGETRSGLYYEGFRILKAKMPKYSIIENVKNLVGKRFRADFDSMLDDIESLGYNNYWQVLNAKDYGIPQNRERVFIVSIRKDVDTGFFEFPEPYELKLRLKDYLEDEVDEKYYLNDALCGNLLKNTGDILSTDNLTPTQLAKGSSGNKFAPINEGTLKNINSDFALTITSRYWKGVGGVGDNMVIVREATKKGYAEAGLWDSINIDQPNSKIRRGRVGKHIANTLTTQQEMAVVEPAPSAYRIRKLTPKECWRLMGFDDADFENARAAGISNSQLYKQAGNSIVVNVLEAIFIQLLKGGSNE